MGSAFRDIPILQDNDLIKDADGNREKLIIFTEHRDTLNYLAQKIRTLFGRDEMVVTIHGGMLRDDRRKVETLFKQDKDVRILIATDAAGEGINLQRAHRVEDGNYRYTDICEYRGPHVYKTDCTEYQYD